MPDSDWNELDRHGASDAKEPTDIRFIRRCLNHWPFRHGKGLLLRLFAPRLKRRDFLIAIEPGVLIPGDLDDWIVLWYFVEGAAKNLSLQLSRTLIKPGDVVVDIGANIGLWVMGAALKAAPEGNVHAFEPMPENFVRLEHNLTLNGLDSVVCRQLALSDRCGHSILYTPPVHNSALGSLQPGGEGDRSIETELVTLDYYCEQQAIDHVDFMKVDVEGAELLVFRGAGRILGSTRAPVIMFETDEVLTARFASSSASVKAILHEYGYELFRYDGSKLESVGVDETHRNQEDLFALQPYHFQQHPILRTLYQQPSTAQPT